MAIKVGFLQFLALATISSVYGQGPLGEFKPTVLENPYNPGGDAGRNNCYRTETMVILSTYVNGYQLHEQNYPLARRIGAEYWSGPYLNLVQGETTRNLERVACNQNLPDSLPTTIKPLTTAGIYLGGDTSAFYKVTYQVFRLLHRDYVSNGCKITLTTYYGDNAAMGKSGSFTITPNQQCAEWPDFKIAATEPWCGKGPHAIYSSYPSGCLGVLRGYKYWGGSDVSTILAGINYFVYFEGADVQTGTASLHLNDTFGPATAPVPSASEAQSPTSAGFKAPLSNFLFIILLPLAMFNFGMGKRATVACLMLYLVLSVRAQDPRTDVSIALVGYAIDYIKSLGRCKSVVSEGIIMTGINGASLMHKFYPSPVGRMKFSGPKLEYISSRTYFNYGNQCNDVDAVPRVIEPNSIKSIYIGDSYWGLAYPEVSMYYRVFKPDGSASNCVLKVYISSEGWTPIFRVTKDSAACDSEIPNLEINHVGYYCGTSTNQPGRCGNASDGPNKWGSAAQVYFGGVAAPSSLWNPVNETFKDVGAMAPAEPMSPNEFNEEEDSSSASPPASTSAATKYVSSVQIVMFSLFIGLLAVVLGTTKH